MRTCCDAKARHHTDHRRGPQLRGDVAEGQSHHPWDRVQALVAPPTDRRGRNEVVPIACDDVPRRETPPIACPHATLQSFIDLYRAYSGTTPVMTAITLNDLERSVTHDAAGNEVKYVVTRTYSPRNLLREVIDDSDPGELLPRELAYARTSAAARSGRRRRSACSARPPTGSAAASSPPTGASPR